MAIGKKGIKFGSTSISDKALIYFRVICSIAFLDIYLRITKTKRTLKRTFQFGTVSTILTRPRCCLCYTLDYSLSYNSIGTVQEFLAVLCGIFWTNCTSVMSICTINTASIADPEVAVLDKQAGTTYSTTSTKHCTNRHRK